MPDKIDREGIMNGLGGSVVACDVLIRKVNELIDVTEKQKARINELEVLYTQGGSSRKKRNIKYKIKQLHKMLEEIGYDFDMEIEEILQLLK